MSQNHDRATPCSVCQSAAAKYRCPSCNSRTCSLACVKLHKAAFRCTGARSRTGYKALAQLGDRELISDLRFLEDVKRVKETNWRELRRVALVFKPQETPPHQRKLRYEARQRGMKLHYLPRGMTRNKCNSSWFDYRTQEICWDIDWIVPFHLNSQRLRKRRVPESLIVSAALTAVLSSLDLVVSPESPFSVVMKKNGCAADQVVYFDFDAAATLRSQLEGKELVEYPVLLILRNQDRSAYRIEPAVQTPS